MATHTRTQTPGQRPINLDHLPTHKVPGLILRREDRRQQAAEIGPATQEAVNRLPDHRPEDRLRTAGRLLRLSEGSGLERLEASCARALRFDDARYATINRILEQGLDAEASPAVDPPPPARVFMRKAAELVGHLVGGAL